MSNKGKSTNVPKSEKDLRYAIAKPVIWLSIIGVLVLALALGITALARGDEDTAIWVLAAVLPVMGAWVGAILAYYFASENFEAATRGVSETAERLSTMERLRSIPVKLKMRARRDMLVTTISSTRPEDQINLVEDILNLLDAKKRNRLPVLDESEHPKYVIHRSMIDKYLIQKATRDKLSTDELDNLTLKQLLDEDLELKEMFETSYVTVSEDATLADAKNAMDKVPNCLDVFVTRDGTKNEPVVGYLTNLRITESARV